MRHDHDAYVELWRDKRRSKLGGDERAILAEKPVSQDLVTTDRCPVCTSTLYLESRQPEHGRDMAVCRHYGHLIAVAEGVL